MKLVKPLVVAVDDEPMNLFLLTELLEDDFDIKTFASGNECLEFVKRQTPDLILLDISMPEMDGYEVCQHLKETPKTSDVPVFFLTARIHTDDELKGLKMGAVDYITKPFSGPVLLNRVHAHVALRRVTKELMFERERVGDIVNRMSKDSRFNTNNMRFFTRGVDETNGDIIFSASSGDDKQIIILGDFTGHGLAAAVCGSVVSSVFYSYTDSWHDGVDICQAIDIELYEKLPAYMFMAALVVQIDFNLAQFTVWNFGMPAAISLPKGGDMQTIKSASLPLGIEREIRHLKESTVIKAKSGDRLFLYTDGVTELTSEEGEMFGEERLKELVTQSTHDDIPIEDTLIPQLKQHSESTFHQDDISFVEIIFP